MINNQNYDVVIFGAGPFGMATAYLLALINKDARIGVYDTREETRRHYALHIAPDSMKAINRILKEHLNNPLSRQAEIKSAIQFFNKWSGINKKTKDIEDGLTEKAKAIGVQVFRNKEYETQITESNFPNLFEKDTKLEKELTPAQQVMREQVSAARVCIGADGRHSVVRKAVLGKDEDVLEEHQLLSYFLEIKYETNPEVQRRNWSTVKESSLEEGMAFETISKERATMHFDITQEAFEHLAEATDKTPWNLAMLKQKALTDPIISKEFDRIEHYLQGVNKRGGDCSNEKIKRLPVEIYRSSKAVALYKNKIVALGGDAHSGAVFARGVNKAFLNAALLAKTTSDYLKNKAPGVVVEVPAEFQKYQIAVQAVFAKEAFWGKLKATAIKTASLVLRLLAAPVIFIRNGLKLVFFGLRTRVLRLRRITA